MRVWIGTNEQWDDMSQAGKRHVLREPVAIIVVVLDDGTVIVEGDQKTIKTWTMPTDTDGALVTWNEVSQ